MPVKMLKNKTWVKRLLRTDEVNKIQSFQTQIIKGDINRRTPKENNRIVRNS